MRKTEKSIGPIGKVDMVIENISGCILELDSSRSEKGIPEMARSLAELLNARTEAVRTDERW